MATRRTEQTRSYFTDDSTDDAAATRRRLARLAWLLDSSIKLPVGNFRIGLDALIGLVPGIGDVAGMAMSSYIVGEAARLGAPRSVLMRMGWNVVVETLIGIIPVAGDVFDMAWRANLRNVRLLEQFLDSPSRTTTVTRVRIASVVALAIGAMTVMGALGIVVLRWVLSAF